MGLIQWLATKQGQLGMSDRKFSSLLGLSFSYWCQLRKGRHPNPGLDLLNRAIAAFPADRDEIVKATTEDCEPAIA